MFDKILIANRGEIACRIVRTAKRMGIATVAVYSDADRYALHTESADESVGIGPALAAQSYLNVNAIIDACKEDGNKRGASGIRISVRGYNFGKQLNEANIEFIGPRPAAIEAMGDKITFRKKSHGKLE